MNDEVMWALVNRSGWVVVVKPLRRDVIRRALDLCPNQTWRQLRREGLSAVKVLVSEYH